MEGKILLSACGRQSLFDWIKGRSCSSGNMRGQAEIREAAYGRIVSPKQPYAHDDDEYEAHRAGICGSDGHYRAYDHAFREDEEPGDGADHMRLAFAVCVRRSISRRART